MRKILGSIVIVSAALVVGCASPVESLCEKGKSCDLLEKDQTVEKCVEEFSKTLDAWKAKKNAACDKIADAYESQLSCMAGLSCAELDKGEGKECEKEQKELEKVMEANFKDCGFES